MHKNFYLFVLVFLGCGHPAVGGAGPDRTYDCGIVSLYQLLTICGRSTDVRVLERSLPEPGPEGYSLQELIHAAQIRDFYLAGVRLDDTRTSPARPAIIYLHRKTHGHYVVIRPVGRSKRLVQVIDADEPPVIVDYEDLRNQPDWTGIALVESKTNSSLILGLAILSTGILLCLFKIRSWPIKAAGGSASHSGIGQT